MAQSDPKGNRKSRNHRRLNFTKSSIDALTVSDGARQTFFHDTRTRGLCICISQTGKKTFYCLRKFKARTERVLIGRYPEKTIAQARQRAGKISSQFDSGLNVNDIKRQERGELTLQAVFVEYMARHAKVYNKHWKQSEDLFQLHLSRWANYRLSLISKHDVAKWHAKIGRYNGIYTANNALTLLKAIFNRAIDWDLFEGSNPTNGTRKFKTISRDRYLFPDEMKRFLEALKNDPEEIYRDFFLLLLLTGARKSNCLSMRWCDLNLDTGVWSIPVTKNGEPQRLPLSPQSIGILRGRAIESSIHTGDVVHLAIGGNGNGADIEEPTIVRYDDSQTETRRTLILKSEYVFPGSGRLGCLADPRKPWRKLLTRAQITDFRVHDLRRTHGSYLAASGANAFIISRALGHKDVATTAIYARLDLDPIRAATSRATDVMLAGVENLLPFSHS